MKALSPKAFAVILAVALLRGGSLASAGPPAPSTNVSITKTDGTASVIAGGSTTYTIRVSNFGPSDATLVRMTDTFPAACASVTYTSSANHGATGNTAAGTGDISDTALDLPGGSSVTYSATCAIDPAATGTLVNTASIGFPPYDLIVSDNSATDTDSITAPASAIIPTLDSPGLAALAVLLAVSAALALRRRRI
jgi:uncharacterized repeat protein (TIGR01451 family)